MFKRAIIFGAIFFSLGVGLCQAQPQGAEPVIKEDVVPSESAVANEIDIQWKWGEVVSVDTANKEIIVTYLDYDTDEEKQIKIATDSNTVFENAQSIADIKTKDIVSVDYIARVDGKNIAQNISVEKPEETITLPSEDIPQESNPQGTKK